MVAYCATEAGMLGMMKVLVANLARDGMRVNAMAPSNVMTPLMREWAGLLDDPAGALESVAKWQKLGRMANAEKIGKICLFLVADATFMMGQCLEADGGMTLGDWSWVLLC